MGGLGAGDLVACGTLGVGASNSNLGFLSKGGHGVPPLFAAPAVAALAMALPRAFACPSFAVNMDLIDGYVPGGPLSNTGSDELADPELRCGDGWCSSSLLASSPMLMDPPRANIVCNNRLVLPAGDASLVFGIASSWLSKRWLQLGKKNIMY